MVLVLQPLNSARQWRTSLCSARRPPASTRPSARAGSRIPSTIAPRTMWRKSARSVRKVRNCTEIRALHLDVMKQCKLSIIKVYISVYVYHWDCLIKQIVLYIFPLAQSNTVCPVLSKLQTVRWYIFIHFVVFLVTQFSAELAAMNTRLTACRESFFLLSKLISLNSDCLDSHRYQ